MTINNYSFCLIIKLNNFSKIISRLVDEITWVKKTVNEKIAKSHGFYLQHAKESCLVGVKGDLDKNKFNLENYSEGDVIFSLRRGQS